MKRIVVALTAAICLTGAFAEENEEVGFDRWYVGASGAVTLPQGGSKMRRLGGADVRGGLYLTEDWAAEATVSWLEDSAGLGVQALWHLQGASLYGDFFGYSRIDPFLTAGARGWIGRRAGQVGPKAGLGTFYHLTDAWSLRADADATLGLETNCEMLYSLSVGIQYSF